MVSHVLCVHAWNNGLNIWPVWWAVVGVQTNMLQTYAIDHVCIYWLYTTLYNTSVISTINHNQPHSQWTDCWPMMTQTTQTWANIRTRELTLWPICCSVVTCANISHRAWTIYDLVSLLTKRYVCNMTLTYFVYLFICSVILCYIVKKYK